MSHADGCEVVSPVVLIHISLMINDVEHFLLCFWTNFYIFFGEKSIQVLWSFSNQVVLLWHCRSPLYIWYINLLIEMICKYFLLFHRLSLYSVDCIILCSKVFNLMNFSVCFFFCCLLLRNYCQIAKSNVMILTLSFLLRVL